MDNYKIIEEYDGRLPIFSIIKEVDSKYQTIKSFDSYNDAEKFLVDYTKTKLTCCGEEDPCN